VDVTGPLERSQGRVIERRGDRVPEEDYRVQFPRHHQGGELLVSPVDATGYQVHRKVELSGADCPGDISGHQVALAHGRQELPEEGYQVVPLAVMGDEGEPRPSLLMLPVVLLALEHYHLLSEYRLPNAHERGLKEQ
jgi:hypothetical protein